MKTNCVIKIIICGLLMAFVHNVCGMPAELAGNVTQGEVGKEAPQPQKETNVEAPKIVTTTQEAPKASTKELPTSEATKKIPTTEEPKALSNDFADDEAPGKAATDKGAKKPSKAPKDVPPPKAPKETKPAEAPKGLPKETITEFAKLEGTLGDGDDNTTTSTPTPITNTTTTPIVTTKEPKKNQADKGIVMNLLNLAIIMTSGRILAM